VTLPPSSAALVLGGRTFQPGRLLVMAIVNRTPDSFYSGARQLPDDVADDAVDRAVAEGADLVDVGGVKAGPGVPVDLAEELDRVVPFVARTRARHPELLISVDTWRAEVADRACDAGAHLVNDTWAGYDPRLPEVAARHGAGLVCSHTGGADPRTRPHRVSYGSTPESVVDDATHDFGKNTWHGLALVRRTEAFVALGHPVLMALSRKDFIGESLGLEVADRLEGTLAATAVAAWAGAKVFRSHDVLATRRVVDMVASIRGERDPVRAVRGLA
jgi:dihydropteroate synthase